MGIVNRCAQGLLGPLSWLDGKEVVLGSDVTAHLGVMKWVESAEMMQYTGDEDGARAPWPVWVPKTDEERIQNLTSLQEVYGGKTVVLSQKYDGCSATYMALNGDPFVCARNYRLLAPTKSTQHYFECFAKYDLAR